MRLLRRIRYWLSSGSRAPDLAEEMAHHRQLVERDLRAEGRSASEARDAARRVMGNDTYMREEARGVWVWPWLEAMWQDAVYSRRGLARTPVFSLAVVATIALGVGANAAMFGIVDQLLLRPPAHLTAPDRSHRLYLARTVNGAERMGQSSPYQRFVDLAASTRTMEVVAAYATRSMQVEDGGDTRDVRIGVASASFWRLFDAPPAVGRYFSDAEENDARVIVLSHRYWQSRYASSPAIVGKRIAIPPSIYTIIGVAPPGLGGVDLQPPDAFIPIGAAARDEFGAPWARDRTTYYQTWLDVYGRRRPNVSVEAATAELTAAYERSYRREASIDSRTPPVGVAKPRIALGPVLANRGPSPSASARVSAWLLGVAGVVLLVACANISNLFVARGLSRRREIAVRVALGVSRGRLVRQQLVEQGLLMLIGLAAGLLIASVGGEALRAFLLPNVGASDASGDPRVWLVAASCALLTVLLAGAPPIFQAMKVDVVSSLRAVRAGLARSRARNALIVIQVTFSVLLLVGAGLFTRSAMGAAETHLGFDAERLLMVQVRMRSADLDASRQGSVRRQLLERARSNPSVEGATVAYSAPLGGTRSGSVYIDGRDSLSRLGEFFEQAASPGYFATMGTRILRGRGITEEDRAGAPLVAVISEGMARALWPNESPLGKCLRRRSPTAPCRTVIGVAENVRLAGLDDGAGFITYYAAPQNGDVPSRMFIRVRGDARDALASVRRDLQAVMPPAAYVVVAPMTNLVDAAARSYRLGAVMFAIFGLLALIVAGMGLYSVIAYGVAQRRHEIGLRIAVGARASDVVVLVVGQAARVVIPGIIAGGALAMAAGRWIEPLLFEVAPRDPLVFAGVGALLVLVAAAASSGPAFRAARLDPGVVIRGD